MDRLLKGESLDFLSLDSIDILLYFDALITNIIKIADKVIFKIKYLKDDFFKHFFRVSRGKSCIPKQGSA